MKKIYSFLIFSAIIALSYNANAQPCTPNTACTDTLNPGEICPETLPNGVVGVPYNQVVTVIPPATGLVGTTPVTLYKIKLKSVTGMPPGLTYQTNPANAEFALYNVAPNTCTPLTNPKYCILISGTPTTAGTYPLSITITPYIYYQVAGSCYGSVSPTDVVDDTSLTIIITPTAGVSLVNYNKFSLLESKPNPFNYSAKIGFISPNSGMVKLKVFDVIGNIIYSETITAIRGENYFDFDGIKLGKGMYIYNISNGKESYTKQLIKN